MPDTAPKVKFNLTRSFGAEVRTYNIATDHQTGERDRLTRQIADEEQAIQASPYDDPHVIAGNGVGGLEIVDELRRQHRTLSHFLCPVSGGGLMAGLALAIADGYPDAAIIGVEPAGADDFNRSLAAGERVRLDHPTSICDGLLSYDVGGVQLADPPEARHHCMQRPGRGDLPGDAMVVRDTRSADRAFGSDCRRGSTDRQGVT